ncbi:DUF3696 domain-containing protein [Salmonella enterica]|uniref:DUF3696 domain-containing protein n=1 Tax=Salmonella enterica TaxID=28901 RepID=UPI000E06CFB7|nr:DUF3696 domain-containing protein [Salmonella enterica subsp. enterica serovar Cairina]EAM8674636.1 DUF3696 domain-containing protein [Salmonella enterica]EBU8906920.1 DUF3696 domain-containing protein [Salmonella enterica subsp. enterica serovar Vuadens]ECJ4938844.1 DUF3696 domain-containing protein [Salmonella enterica subsp. enterica]EEJ6908393.1 DUF3696 domain-containing protein [Salmonella enterica subsp. enterica serovar Stanleyville]
MKYLKINGFKCFDEVSLALSNLTLLTGFNAAGKSSLIQSILLMAQAIKYGNNAPEILLNGPLVNLGLPSDVFHQSKSDGEEQDAKISFSFELDDCKIAWHFQYPRKRNYPVLALSEITYHGNGNKINDINNDAKELLPDVIKEKVNSFDSLVYLSACRLGAVEIYPIPSDFKYSDTNVGVQGEYAAWLMEQNKDEDIIESRCHDSDPALTLRRQINAWLKYILPNSEADTRNIDKASLVQLFFRNDGISEWRRPANIGYGLTYVFPIIVAGLLAKNDQILVIDSPEAHLHPLGQSRIGEFLSTVANSGVKVIIETHSDHILNGVRLSVNDGVISSDNVGIHFFEKNSIDNKTRVISPQIDMHGNLSEWPEGFFDQSDKDLGKLIGW